MYTIFQYYTLVFKKFNREKLLVFFEALDLSIDFELFEQLYLDATAEPFNLLYIDRRDNTYRRHFNREFVIKIMFNFYLS